MQVTYNAPNRAHHYRYAVALAQAGCLRAFVSGFSRFSSRAAIPEVGDRLVRADQLQNVYLLGLKVRLPDPATDMLAFCSRGWLDRKSERFARESDIFLFYNGAGLHSLRRLKGTNVVCVAEAVSSHVLVQQRILQEEHKNLGIPFRPFPRYDVRRRVAEYTEAHAVLCPSAFVRDSLISEGVPLGNVMTVPYGFTLRVSSSRKPDSDVFRILYVGQIHIRKGLRYLIEAFGRLKHPRKELLVVGPNTSITGITDLAIPSQVIFAGTLKGAALENAYRSANVFVLPSLEEGLALVIGEALSFGLPVIATVNTGWNDLFDDGVEGWHIPIRDPRAILARLQLLADDGELAERMSGAARKRAQELGGWDASGKLLVSALKSLHRSMK